MAKGLDHALLCVACFVLNILCGMCGELRELYTWYIVYGTLGLENITLGVREKQTEQDSSEIELNYNSVGILHH